MMACAQLWQEAQSLAAGFPDRSWQHLSRMLAQAGQYARQRGGEGQDFWQYRQLGEGESAARVDWRKSARSDTFLVREHEQQSPQRRWLWCDMSPSMHYRGSRAARSKAEQAYLLGAILCHLATNAGDTMKLLGHSNAPRSDMAFLLAGRQRFDISALREDDLLFVISDFIGVDLDQRPNARLVAFHVQDPDEIDFPFEGHVRFEGLEAEASLLARDATSLRQDYLAAQAELWSRIQIMFAASQACNSADAPATQVQNLIQTLRV
jgi:uncharacterized protein (DUF58 family)